MARLVVRVQPNARRTGFCGWYGDLPKFAVREAPVDGAANAAVEAGIAAALDLPRRAVTLVGGAASRTKRLDVDGIAESELARVVAGLNGWPS